VEIILGQIKGAIEMTALNLIGWQGFSSLGMGIGCGIAEFVFHTTAQKVAMAVGNLDVQGRVDPDDGVEILSFERLQKQFVRGVLYAPIGEEICLRGIMQPLLSFTIASYSPHLEAIGCVGISQATLISLVATANCFGVLHYPDYEKGAALPVTLACIAGAVFGLVREKFGLIAAIGAHMTSNLCSGLLDQCYPQFLENERERKLRVLPPQEREQKLLQEAICRIETEFKKSGKTDLSLNLLCLQLGQQLRSLQKGLSSFRN